jgi:hypothetical protein
METAKGILGEWNAPALRPVAHWVTEAGRDGRTRLVMQWRIPNLEEALARTAPSYLGAARSG